MARYRLRHGDLELSRDIWRFRQIVRRARDAPVRNEHRDISNGLGGRTDLSSVDDPFIERLPPGSSRSDRDKVRESRERRDARDADYRRDNKRRVSLQIFRPGRRGHGSFRGYVGSFTERRRVDRSTGSAGRPEIQST